ncbi:MAG: LysE family translocator [Achromobacter sp.]|jgi:threonine/homoserine/homoserine lactone efflux protein|uniref:Cysteine/O-acetylserine efflux protein n=1 Tax=Achromobacter insuavis TaxID=1287735 RepID=A0A6J4ZZD4_9BURK|nr:MULTISPECIES: LysE family translocator [Achromobacter]MBN9641138.1 LysE family translocator [Achromobacter sp.]CAB3648118.1 Cysteine/O-acetylserine efflux protein [Achromobacter insuavis]CAB3874530.1 Cysteine/O-acetylserine efflux protein [Achromobacter insuavis]CUJ04381.1 Cysteine/O-acetylserine efflux protein [Achromobacter sp. 2789STDY5608628]CUJ52491.1 Cysteine/O-acetylserine efflux protein [Achromobacter sp. 2789STDY5608621]
MTLFPASLADVPLASLSLLGPLALFALVSSITPGPNNVMLAASGLNFGFRRSMPHLLGVNLGFTLMIFLVGVGLGSVFQQVPQLYTVLKYVGAAYLLYLAWKIANSGGMEDGAVSGKPMTFLQAAAFQWVNPKAWVMAVGVIATYTPQAGFFANLVIATVVCGIVNLPSIGIWVTFGTALRRVLHKPWAIRAFNISMALLLVASLYPVALEALH